jgi:hypothetical protein
VQDSFIDYKKGPGFWFYFEMLVASDVCQTPLLSAKYTDFSIEGKDLFEVFDKGLQLYGLQSKYRKSILEL